MQEYIPYDIRTGHPADFEVEYEILQPNLEGNKRMLYPGIRCDFLYDGDVPEKDGMWMIWPEFQNEQGSPITNPSEPALPKGNARMWIVRPSMRAEVHQKRIKVGTRGYLMAGPYKLANVKVTKIEGLHTNPTQESK